MHGSGPPVDDEPALTAPVEVPEVEASVVLPEVEASDVLPVDEASVVPGPVVGVIVVVGAAVVSVDVPSVTDVEPGVPVVDVDGSVIVALVVELSSAHPDSAGPDNASE